MKKPSFVKIVSGELVNLLKFKSWFYYLPAKLLINIVAKIYV